MALFRLHIGRISLYSLPRLLACQSRTQLAHYFGESQQIVDAKQRSTRRHRHERIAGAEARPSYWQALRSTGLNLQIDVLAIPEASPVDNVEDLAGQRVERMCHPSATDFTGLKMCISPSCPTARPVWRWSL